MTLAGFFEKKDTVGFSCITMVFLPFQLTTSAHPYLGTQQPKRAITYKTVFEKDLRLALTEKDIVGEAATPSFHAATLKK